MKAICVDDEKQALQNSLSLCREMLQLTAVEGFSSPREALAWAEKHPVDLAVLDIQMPEMDGITLAGCIRRIHPDAAILFVTGHTQYTADAWKLHATGYVLKPLTRERLFDELNYAAEWRRRGAKEKQIPHIAVQTFGNFDLIVDGKKVNFARSKSKELFAYLVDKKGIRVSRPEAFGMLWPDEEYTRAMQKQLDVIIRSLRATLRDNGISEILQLQQGMLRIVPQFIDCDMYRLLAGDEHYENEYQGEYMTPYAWTSQTEGHIDSELRRRRALRALEGLRKEDKELHDIREGWRDA